MEILLSFEVVCEGKGVQRTVDRAYDVTMNDDDEDDDGEKEEEEEEKKDDEEENGCRGEEEETSQFALESKYSQGYEPFQHSLNRMETLCT